MHAFERYPPGSPVIMLESSERVELFESGDASANVIGTSWLPAYELYACSLLYRDVSNVGTHMHSA